MARHSVTNQSSTSERVGSSPMYCELSNGNAIVQTLIGGVLDNAVGYLFVRDAEPPSIGGKQLIYVEHIKGGWYIYKTT